MTILNAKHIALGAFGWTFLILHSKLLDQFKTQIGNYGFLGISFNVKLKAADGKTGHTPLKYDHLN